MKVSWIPRLGSLLVVLLLAAGLIVLQVSNAETELVSCIPGYVVIAIAALIGFLGLGSPSRLDKLCLASAILFFGYLLLRALTSPAPYVARSDLYCILAVLTVYLLTVSALENARLRLALLFCLLIFGAVHVWIALIQTGLGKNLALLPSFEGTGTDQRASGLYVNPNHLAGLLEVLAIFGLSITCWSRYPRWAKVIFGYLTAVTYLGLILTGSRGGYLGAIFSLCVFVMLSFLVLRAGESGLLLRIGGSSLLLLLAGIVAVGLFVQRSAFLSGRLQNLAEDDGRLELSAAALQQWKLAPIFGTGGETYRFYGREFRSARMQSDPVNAHNDYLQLLAEYGALGFVAFAFFSYAHLRHGWIFFLRTGPRRIGAGSWLVSDRLSLTMGALGATASYVIHSAFDFNLHVPGNALLLAFTFGILAKGGSNDDVNPARLTAPRFQTLASAIVAAVLLVQCLRLWPGEYYTEKARIALRDEDPQSAMTFAEQGLHHETKNPNLYFYLGRALMAVADEEGPAEQDHQRYLSALTAFGHAYKLSPLDGSYATELAFLYDRLGRFSEAEWMYGVAYSRDPRSHALAQLYRAHLRSWAEEGTSSFK